MLGEPTQRTPKTDLKSFWRADTAFWVNFRMWSWVRTAKEYSAARRKGGQTPLWPNG